MFDLEQWKKDWVANALAYGSNLLADADYSEMLAQRCRNIERLLLLDLVQHLARVQTAPSDLLNANPELVQLQEAARLVGG